MSDDAPVVPPQAPSISADALLMALLGLGEEVRSSPMDGPACRKLVEASLRRWRKSLPKRVDRFVSKVQPKFRRFAREAKGDLEFLCGKGANPFVLVWIVDGRLWWWCDVWRDLARNSDADRRQLLSPAYWSWLMKVLGKAEKSLSLLASNEWVRLAVDMNPDCEKNDLIPLSKQVLQAGSSVRKLLSTIRELGLDQPGWGLVPSAPGKFPRLVKTGSPMGGRPVEEDWGACAAALYSYLMLTTRRPHWVSIARLLGAAGVKEFSRAIPGEGRRASTEYRNLRHDYREIYASTIRKRIERIRRDKEAWYKAEQSARGWHAMFGRDGMVVPSITSASHPPGTTG